MDTLKPCVETIQKFHHIVFGKCEGFIALRSYSESGAVKQPSRLKWIENSEEAYLQMVTFADEANMRDMACYCIPATVKELGKAGSVDVFQMQTLLVDIDTGDAEAKLAHATSHIGKPTLIVESGGITDAGFSKLHVYWRWDDPVQDEKLKALVRARHDLAIKIGGDISFQSAHQPIRIAGSIYHKTQSPKLVTVRSITNA